jgi:tripartite-type tricarboxylate transporter receptor subunit TctC
MEVTAMRKGVSIFVLLAVITSIVFGQLGNSGHSSKSPITVIIPFKAGSTTDLQVRFMQKYLEDKIGTNLVIINQDGGSGIIGTTTYINDYKSDGNSILYALATPVVYKPLTGDTKYTYENDLQAVSRTMSSPMYLVVRNNYDKTATELIQFIKSKPGAFKYAHVGTGGNGHLAFAAFLGSEGLKAVAIPYSGGTADCYAATMGKQVDAYVVGEADLGRDGVKPLINLGSKSSNNKYQDVPTLDSLGYKGYETNNLAGFYYKKGVDKAIIAAFDSAVKSVLSNEKFLAEAQKAGFTFIYGDSVSFDREIRVTIEKAMPVMQELKLDKK